MTITLLYSRNRVASFYQDAKLLEVAVMINTKIRLIDTDVQATPAAPRATILQDSQ